MLKIIKPIRAKIKTSSFSTKELLSPEPASYWEEVPRCLIRILVGLLLGLGFI